MPRKQEAALAALLSSATIKSAAEKVGVNERTLRTWLKQPGFRATFDAARRELLDDAIRILQQSSSTAAATLLKLLANETTPDAIKLAAASRILELNFRAHEVFDLQKRIEMLESFSQKAEVPPWG